MTKHRGRILVGLIFVFSPQIAHGSTDGEQHNRIECGDPEVSRLRNVSLLDKERARQAAAQRLPKLSLRAQWRQEWVAGTGAFPHSPGYTRKRILSLNLTLPIVDTAARFSALSAKATAAASRARVGGARSQLALRAALARGAVIRDREQLELAEQHEQVLSKLIDAARLRLEAGVGAVGDLYEATSQHAKAVAQVADAHVRHEDALTALSLVSGAGSLVESSGAKPATRSEAMSAEPLDRVIERALRHPLLVAAEYEVMASELRLASTRATHLPTVAFEAGYSVATGWSQQYGRMGAGIRHNGRFVGAYFVKVKVPLFASRAAVSVVQQEMHGLEKARDALDVGRRVTGRTVRDVYRIVRGGPLLIETARSAVQSAGLARDATIVGVSTGTHNSSDRLRAELRLAQARAAESRTRYEVAEKQSILKEMLGI